MNLKDIRAALAQAHEAIDGLNVYPALVDEFNTPALMFRPADNDFRATFDGSAIDMVGVLYTSSVTVEGQDQLDDLLELIPDVIDANPSLSGAVASCAAMRFEAYDGPVLDDGRRFYRAYVLYSIYA